MLYDTDREQHNTAPDTEVPKHYQRRPKPETDERGQEENKPQTKRGTQKGKASKESTAEI